MRAQLRGRLLMAGLALSLAATAWVASRDEEGEAFSAAPQNPTRPGAVKPASPTAWPEALLAAPNQDGPAWPDPAAIARQSWGLAAGTAPEVATVSPAAKVVAAKADSEAEAAPPAAPPLAYQLVGRMDEAGRPRIVLSNAQRTLVLGVGELIDQQWRIDAIGPAGAQLTWLAGGQKQNLAFSSPQS
ncbi:hypothetical protein [Roseateles oligotrophus]|uniref:General secretion pathway protein GspN n=1 Tax=Roseateles oligotrophus TaxID=1769250 RepID=A0ABT2YAI3_9BURK|nr:hypothetical protein [Roseateles oligotrophus]MCV2367311.1 hypothetical protein [Roseateles oligotrophus]